MSTARTRPLAGVPDSDSRLMARLAAGDAQALAPLIARHGPGVRALARRYLGDAVLAEDIVQETFLRVWTRAYAFDPDKGAPRPWIYRIAVNQCTDTYRRRRLRSAFGLTSPSQDPPHDPPDERPGAFDLLADRQQLARTRAAMARLPQRQRMALLMSVAAEMPTEEIARAMDSSVGAVEQLLVRARKKLRAALDDERD